MEENTNYIKIQCKSFFSAAYAYLDTERYLADDLFIKHKVCVKYGNEFASKDSDYRIIFCKVKKADEDNFLIALEELKNKMLLMGHTDYEKVYTSLLGNALNNWRANQK